MPEKDAEKSTADALQQWRAAERSVAVARRGTLAAKEAASAAAETAEARSAAAACPRLRSRRGSGSRAAMTAVLPPGSLVSKSRGVRKPPR